MSAELRLLFVKGKTMQITGTWALEFWRRYNDDGSVSNPFGESPSGLLIYTSDGDMAVMMVPQGRPQLATDDPVGGTEAERAEAYSTCLAYVGRYRVDGDNVIHELQASLFPNWSGTDQVRPFVLDGKRLVLQVRDTNGRVTSEIAWTRRGYPSS